MKPSVKVYKVEVRNCRIYVVTASFRQAMDIALRKYKEDEIRRIELIDVAYI